MRKWFGVVVVLLVGGLAFTLWGSMRSLVVESPRPSSVPQLGVLADPGEVYDPSDAGEPLPDGYRTVFPRDAIAPVYDPTFVEAAAADWSDDTLVIGVELQGEAKAYPVGFLNAREMVIDRLAGIPILVTW